VELHESLFDSNERLFSQDKVAILPVVRTQIKKFVVSSGISSKIIPNIFTGQLPRNIIISFVDSTAYNGASSRNPYNFKHFNLKNISLRVDGITTPSMPYFMNLKKIYQTL